MAHDESCTLPVAYFCAEFGLQADLPIYAGGLGILAGDTVKEAADMKLGMVAVGLLYRGVKTVQKIDESGWQTEEDIPIDPVASGFEHVYRVDDEEQPLFVKIHLTIDDVWARVWKKTVNNVTLYLLDTDTDQNEADDRHVTHALYYGDEETLIRQQLILGIGGVKVLSALGIKPCVFHVNEGRPAFLFWELISELMDEGLSYEEAKAKAKERIVYTNHTLVRAGNQLYNTDILRTCALYYAEKMGVTIDELLSPGVDETVGGAFNMTLFALNTSHRASAVSQIHHTLSKSIWPEFDWVNVTNGVHMPTWQHQEIVEAKDDPQQLWATHLDKKRQTMEFIRSHTGYGYDPDRLVLCWARRIAGYKRPNSLFEDVARLKAILTNQDRPVQLLLAGKAHASDTAAKKLLQEIIKLMQTELSGHALFIPNYNIDIARMITSGVDVWVNTPIPGQEASGTSGMKAIANGVLQLTVEDGWAAEVDWHETGWSLDGNHLPQTFYFRLEEDVVPAYYNRNEAGIPEDWVARMQRSIELSKQFSTTRMLQEYRDKLYT